MMIKKLKEACATMATASRLRDDKAAVEKLNADLKSLKNVADGLRLLAEVIQTMQTSGITSAVLTSQQLDSLNRCINICGEKTSNSTLSTSDVSALNSTFGTCQLAAEQVWKASASEKADGVYGSLNSLKGLLPNRSNTEELLKRLSNNKNTLPKSGQAVYDFLNDVESAQKLVNSLQLDAEIEIFIVKVITQQATVTDRNDHVLSWIKDNHLTSKLKIRF